jgi:predicted SAM-dependent methyltransferase
MKETRKAYNRRSKSPIFHKVFKGRGIDIGCGNNPLDKNMWKDITELEKFDKKQGQGDAQYITGLREKNKYDFVYSSHCLEHMIDPFAALKEWWQLVKKGGYLIFAVPDEDLYEEGVFPSRYNPDHKHTFTIFKWNSWSSKSIDIFKLLLSLDDCKILKIELVDTDYDYNLNGVDQSRGKAEMAIEVILLKRGKENNV